MAISITGCEPNKSKAVANMEQNNPPAFPSPSAIHGQPNEGMTLQDYFAAKAMQSMFAGEGARMVADRDERYNETNWAQIVASNAYDMADAMVAERSRRQDKAPVADVPDYVIRTLENALQALEWYKKEREVNGGTAPVACASIQMITETLHLAVGEKGGEDNA